MVRVISFRAISTASIFFNWVKEAGQTGTMARHNTQNGQKCSANYSPFKSTFKKLRAAGAAGAAGSADPMDGGGGKA